MADIYHELLDDSNLDPKKLFDEAEYNTLIIKRDGFNKIENSSANLIESLVSKSITRSECEDIFIKLKLANASKLLLNSILEAKRMDEKIILTSACWESGLDFTNDFLFFVELTCHDELKLAIEAFTVVENIAGFIADETLNKALDIAQNNNKNRPLANELISIIKERMH